jgi:hypothetical protein
LQKEEEYIVLYSVVKRLNEIQEEGARAKGSWYEPVDTEGTKRL